MTRLQRLVFCIMRQGRFAEHASRLLRLHASHSQLVRAPGPEQRIYETGRSRAAPGGVRALAWLQHWAFACQLLFGGRSRAARRPMTRLQRLVFCIMRQGRGLSSNRHLLCEYRSVDHTFWRSCCTCLCDSLCHV